MKNLILVAALVLVSTSAMAGDERVVSATNGDYYGSCKGEACETAKQYIYNQKQWYEKIVEFSKCDCDKNENGKWTCTVDARLEKTR